MNHVAPLDSSSLFRGCVCGRPLTLDLCVCVSSSWLRRLQGACCPWEGPASQDPPLPPSWWDTRRSSSIILQINLEAVICNLWLARLPSPVSPGQSGGRGYRLQGLGGVAERQGHPGHRETRSDDLPAALQLQSAGGDLAFFFLLKSTNNPQN